MGEVLLGAVRLSHALAAAVWVGGTLVYALLPATDPPGLVRPAVRAYREALRAGIGVFVVSGALLSVERLGSAALPPSYFAILALKIVLGIWMFAVARHIGAVQAHPKGPGALWTRPEYRVIALGGAIYALAIALRAMYESVIRL